MANKLSGIKSDGFAVFPFKCFCYPSMSLCKVGAFARLVVNPFRRTMLLVNKVMDPKNHAPCKQSYDPSVS